MNDQKFFDLSAKRLSSTITPQEDAALNRFLAENPDQLKAFEELKSHWMVSGQLKLKYDEDPHVAWEKFSNMRSNQGPKTVHWTHFAMRLAAMAVLTIGLGFLFREYGKSEPYYYATFEGETKWVVLSDSSKVRLNESSLLTVAEDFNEDNRHVILKGEAFFEVARNEAKPFVVKTGEASTRVLGTSFNIRAIADAPSVSIYVKSGKVSFAAEQGEGLILTKGMAANYMKENNAVVLNGQESNALAWHSRVLKFDDSRLDKVFADLREYFNVDIRMASDNIKNCRFTGEFKEPNLDEILKIISISAEITYTKSNNRYTFQGEGCKPSN